MKITPAKDRVICKLPTAEERGIEKSKGGILLPESSKERPQLLTVLWSGSELYPAGTDIIVPLYQGMELRLFNDDFLVFKAEDIHGRLED